MNFNEDEITLFQDIIERGRRIVGILKEKGKEEASKDADFNELFLSWRMDSLRFMESHFDKTTPVFGIFAKAYTYGTNLKNAHYLQEAVATMESYYKMPDNKNMNNTSNQGGININVNQSQSQNQTQSQQQSYEVLLEAIKDELSGKQVKELQTILADTSIDDETKKTSFIDKLKSFGEGTMASILANVITNSTFWAGFTALF